MDTLRENEPRSTLDQADRVAAEGARFESAAGMVRKTMPEEGTAGTVTRAVADPLERAGSYLQERRFSGMIADLEELIRRHPIQSLLLGFGLGYLLSRINTR